MTLAEKEAVRLSAVLLTAERWTGQYAKAPVQHAQLIKATAELQLVLRKYFRSMANQASDFFNHYQYLAQVKPKSQKLQRTTLDFNVDVIINDDQLDEWDQPFIQVSLKTVNKMVTAGAQAGEVIHQIPLGIQSTDAIIQQLSLDHVANLVGKRIVDKGLPTEHIIDNPNAEYNITDTVRADIAASVKTSLELGETTDEAVTRMQQVIDNPVRAERIANTEAVNAYQSGLLEFGSQSGAVAKEWDDLGAIDICAENAAQDPIAMDDSFDSGDDAPPAHPNCLCSLRLIYQDELDANDSDSTDE